jgi:hypothetical protein
MSTPTRPPQVRVRRFANTAVFARFYGGADSRLGGLKTMLMIEKHKDGGITLTSAIALCDHMSIFNRRGGRNWPDEAERWEGMRQALLTINVANGRPPVEWLDVDEAITEANGCDNPAYHIRLLPPHGALDGETP